MWSWTGAAAAEVIYVNDNYGDWTSSHFRVSVPPDAVAHIYADLATAALTMMERNMRADLTPSSEVGLEES